MRTITCEWCGKQCLRRTSHYKRAKQHFCSNICQKAYNWEHAEELFWSHVGNANANGCREWTRRRDKENYGRVGFRSKSYRAHRLAWTLANKRRIPKNMEVCHSCDNPPCCEPTHLFLGTRQDNMDDMHRKARGRWQRIV